MFNMELSPNYDEIFTDRLVVITGVARSGTSILEKIIGSFTDTYYSFEPVSFALIPPLIKNGFLPKEQGGELLKAILFEDIFLQMIHGRNVNFNEKDDSYIGNYIDPEIIKKSWSKFRRRQDVMEYLKETDYLFVIKNPNIQPVMDLIDNIFPGVRFIHILRDGNEVISSSIRKGFYSEDYFNKRSVDCWSGREINGINIPWFIEETENFSKWNQYTRCAHIWRILNEMGLKFAGDNADKVMQSRLEDVTTNPEKFVDSAERFLERKKTDITKKNLESIKTYQQMEYPNNTLHIEGSEKERYIKFMETLGYSMTK